MSTKRMLGGRTEILWGLLFIVFGGVWLLHNLRILYVGDMWSHWPLIIVVVGVIKFSLAETLGQRGQAAWWIFIGSWLYVSIHEIFGLGFGQSWPILIIAWGISILWGTFLSTVGNRQNKEM